MSDREITLKIEGTRGATINKGMYSRNMGDYVANINANGYATDYRKVQCYIMGEDEAERNTH